MIRTRDLLAKSKLSWMNLKTNSHIIKLPVINDIYALSIVKYMWLPNLIKIGRVVVEKTGLTNSHISQMTPYKKKKKKKF